MQGKDMLTLWILFCRVDAHGDTFFPFYARDREQAERKAEDLLRGCPYERLDLKEYPYGFRIVMTTLPGRIEENAE